jgi:hypothetical protein
MVRHRTRVHGPFEGQRRRGRELKLVMEEHQPGTHTHTHTHTPLSFSCFPLLPLPLPSFSLISLPFSSALFSPKDWPVSLLAALVYLMLFRPGALLLPACVGLGRVGRCGQSEERGGEILSVWRTHCRPLEIRGSSPLFFSIFLRLRHLGVLPPSSSFILQSAPLTITFCLSSFIFLFPVLLVFVSLSFLLGSSGWTKDLLRLPFCVMWKWKPLGDKSS